MSDGTGPVGSRTAYIGMGSNLGDRFANLGQAVEKLTALGLIRSVSAVYETDPVGFVDQPAFLNAAVSLQTDLVPPDLLVRLLAIEHYLGRVRSFANAPRTIDLDLLFVDDVVLDATDVKLPHPHLHERFFVLMPLADIAPNLMHPTMGVTISELLKRLGTVSGVRRIPESLGNDQTGTRQDQKNTLP